MTREPIRHSSKFHHTMLTAYRFLMRYLPVTACTFLFIIEETAAHAVSARQITDAVSGNLGLGQLIADIYRENLLLYGVMTVIVMTTIGLALGYLVEFILKLMKINLGKLERTE